MALARQPQHVPGKIGPYNPRRSSGGEGAGQIAGPAGDVEHDIGGAKPRQLYGLLPPVAAQDR